MDSIFGDLLNTVYKSNPEKSRKFQNSPKYPEIFSPENP